MVSTSRLTALRQGDPAVRIVDLSAAGRDNRAVLFAGAERSLLIDTGTAEGMRELLADDPRALRPDLVLNTHPDIDHWGGNQLLRTHVRTARFLAHPADAALIRSPERLRRERYDELAPHGAPHSPDYLDQIARENPAFSALEELLPGLLPLAADWAVEVLHLPGHSAGHLGVWDETHRVLVIGDAALGQGILDAQGAPLMPATYRLVDDYLATIERLERMPFEVLCTAHFGILDRAAGLRFLTDSRSRAIDDERALREVLSTAGGPLGAAELARRFSEATGPWGSPRAPIASGQPVLGHLERWEAHGIARRGVADDGLAEWTLASA